MLKKSFFNRPTLQVAQDLLGCFLVREDPPAGGGIFEITETEAYNGPDDLASHASRGKTERNKIMFEGPGLIYIYLIYGMHYMLNIVTEKKDYPAAVLIRGIESANGPAKLTKFLNIDKSFNGLQIYKKTRLWINDRKENIKPSQIIKTTRVGIDYAKEYKDKKWRFILNKG